MECKETGEGRGGEHDGDLIDTLWNVKHPSVSALLPATFDLIDTLWNVKAGRCKSTAGRGQI